MKPSQEAALVVFFSIIFLWLGLISVEVLKQRQRITNVQREQERLWHKIAVVNTVSSGNGVLQLWIGNVPLGTVSNDMFFPAMTNASAGKKD